MEGLRNRPANKETLARLIAMAQQLPLDDLVPTLRNYTAEMVERGYPTDQLYVDMLNAHMFIAEDGAAEMQEDALLDAMDYLTGWCAPDARIYPADR